jgi:hypothetical protein
MDQQATPPGVVPWTSESADEEVSNPLHLHAMGREEHPTPHGPASGPAGSGGPAPLQLLEAEEEDEYELVSGGDRAGDAM